MREILGDPFGTSSGELMIDDGFIKWEVGESGLVIDRPGVHSLNEFHDGITKIRIASKNGTLDR